MMIKKIIDKRLLPILVVLSLLFGISLVALAEGGNGSGGGSGNAGVQPTMAGTGFQLRLSNPDVSMSNDGGTYVLDGEYDPTQDIVFTFSFNPNGGQLGFGIYPATNDSPAGFEGVVIYDKTDSDKVPALSLGGNYSADTMNPNFFFTEIEDAAYPDHMIFKDADSGISHEKTSDLTIKANSLKGGKTYCLYLPGSMTTYNNGRSKQLGVDITIEFKTTKSAPEAVKTWAVGECTATLYDNGNFIVGANEGGSGIANGMEPPPWFLDGTDRTQIKQAEIRDGVTSIGLFFFMGCGNLSRVDLPETLETIGPVSFAESGIERIEIPAGVKTIPDSTFNSCKKMTEVKFQEGLETIGEGAFLGCESLPALTLPSTVKTIAANAFSEPAIKDVYIQSNADDITIDKWACGHSQCATTFHVKCDQSDEFEEKNSEIINVTFSGDIHTPGDTVKENDVPATCTAEGSYDEVVYCSVCNEEVSRATKTIEALGHTEEDIAAVAATCAETGLTEGKKCSVCGEVLEAQKEIPALGHNYEVIPEVISTCTAKGSTAGAKCTRCGEYLIEPKEVPMILHEEETIPGKAATCTESGMTEGKKCSVCGEILEEQKEIPALGHTEEVVKGKAATCTEKGLTDGKKCSVCGEILEEQKEIPALGHTEEVVKGKAATCTEKGLTDGKKCSVCGEWIEEQKEIPALGHEEKVVKEAKAATCTEDGWTAEIKCARCGESLQKSEPVKAKGHHEVYDSEVMSTCTETGLTFGIHCSECGQVIKEQVVVPKERHDVRRIAGKDATCTEKGLTDGEKCAVCGEILEAQKEIPALGHKYKDGVCTRCDEKDPNYKPAEPEPAPAEPEVPLNGIVKGKDGKWAMYKDDKVDTSYTGIAKNAYGWWRVEDGYVNFDAQGIYRNEYGWWKTTDGKVTFEETGIFKNEYGWWRVEDSKVNFDAQEIYKNKYGWWKTTDGKVTFEETGVFKNKYGWWRVEKSKVNFKAQEIYKNQYGWWKTTDGKVTFKETGIFKNEYGTWYVKDSKVDFSKNGTVNYNQKAYIVKDGKAKLA